MWFVFAFLNSWISAIYYLCNQQSKLNPHQFIIYRGFIAALATTPFMIANFHIFPFEFYIIVLFQAIIISYTDRKYYEAFQKFGAENVNSIRPLDVAITFIIWLIINPAMILVYMETPYRFCAITISIIGIVISVIKYRGNAIGLACLKYILPLLLLSSFIDMSNKIIMNYADQYLITAAIHRVALTGWLIGFINLFADKNKKKTITEISNPHNIAKGSFILWLVLSMVILNLSMYHAPHPAYCTAVFYLSVVWLVLINKIKQWQGKKIKYQNIEKKWIFLLLISTIILVLATN